MRLTSGGEAGAFLLARAIVIAVLFVVTPTLLAPLYVQLLHMGGPALLMATTTGVSLLMWLVTLLLFLAFRAGFGAVPTVVAPENRAAFISSGGEIGAFLISTVLVIVAVAVLSSFLLAGLYASLRTSGHADAVQEVAFAVSAATAVIFFLLFIALRGAMSASPPAADAGGGYRPT